MDRFTQVSRRDCEAQHPLRSSISFTCEMPVAKDYRFAGLHSYGLCGAEIDYGSQKKLDDLVVCPQHFERVSSHE